MTSWASRKILALDPGERSLRAIVVRVERGIATVEKVVAEDRPSDIDPSDLESYGRWLGDTLRRSGMSVGAGAGEVIVTIDREQTTIRRLELPTTDVDELPDMARLAMHRDTQVEGGSLAVDLLLRGHASESNESKGMPVLIAAASERAIDRARRLVETLGGKSPVVTVRTFGTARLLRDLDATPEAKAVVGIDCSGEAIELVVVRGGEIVYTRGVRLADSDALASEAKRSWMSYRFTQADEPIGAAVVFGGDAVREALAPALDRVIGSALVGFAPSASIRIAAGLDRDALALCLPLVGLALERCSGDETIDLASPRKAPDFAARRRIRVLAAAGVLVVACLIGWTIGNMQRKSFEANVADLADKATGALPELERFKRDSLKLEHLKTWSAVKPDWLEHARFLYGFTPDSTKVVLNSFIGTLDASDVQYGRNKKWSVVADLKVTLDGEAKDRTVADALRDALVENGRYTVTSTGADTEGGRRLSSPFSYVLRTSRPQSPQETAPTGEPKSDEKSKPATKEASP